jgi:hypothetical protein
MKKLSADTTPNSSGPTCGNSAIGTAVRMFTTAAT